MKIVNLFEDVKIDNVRGAGAVSKNQDVDYFGIRVNMKPSTFMKLAAAFTPHPSKYEPIVAYLKAGGAIGSPFLSIEIPDGWFSGDFTELATVTGHEGRHRMHAIHELYGDIPIEVHIWADRWVRARHLTDRIKAQLNKYMIKERSDTVVRGPLFELI